MWYIRIKPWSQGHELALECHTTLGCNSGLMTTATINLTNLPATKQKLLKYLKVPLVLYSHFYRASSYAIATLAVVIPSVRHTRALWQNQTMHCGHFDTVRKGNHSSFLTPTVVGGRHTLPSEICAQSDPPFSKDADFDIFPLITSQP